MRRYEFHSVLPPELVFAILDTNTKPWDLLATGDGTFRYKRKKDGFWLTYTGDLPATGDIPFWGEVRAEGAGSVITGGFPPLRAALKPMAAIWGVMCVPVMLLGVPFPVYLLMFALSLLVGTGFRSAGQKAFFSKRQQAVLAFIQENLLQ